jgi:NCS1 family nucleobase:cation symporter-1
VALVFGVGVALVGLIVPPLHFLYDYAWFVGFFGSGVVYIVSMRMSGAGLAAGRMAAETDRA